MIADFAARGVEWWREGGGYYNARYLGSSTHFRNLQTTGALVQCIERITGIRPPLSGSVLDAACGMGRVLHEMARRGYKSLVGIDINTSFLAEGDRIASEHSLDISFRLQDVRWVPDDWSFDLVLCVGGSAGQFSDRGNRAALRTLAGAVAPGGCIVVEMERPPSPGEVYPLRTETLPDGTVSTTEVLYDSIVHRMFVTEKKCAPDGTTDILHMNTRMYSTDDLAQILRDCGLEPSRYHLDYWHYQEVEEGSPAHYRGIVVARKPA